QVTGVPDSSHFTVTTTNPATMFGSCLAPKWSGGGYVQSRTNVALSMALPHGLAPGDSVFVNFTAAGSPADGVYQVQTVPDATHFTILVTNSVNVTQNGQIVYPLIAPPLTRAGNLQVQWRTWGVHGTDSGAA